MAQVRHILLVERRQTTDKVQGVTATARHATSVVVGDEIQIGVTSEASANQQEIARRREIVRQFFNDFWRSTPCPQHSVSDSKQDHRACENRRAQSLCSVRARSERHSPSHSLNSFCGSRVANRVDGKSFGGQDWLLEEEGNMPHALE